jgi:hypothetical protein
MQIGGMGGAAAIWLNSLGKTAEAGAADAFAPTKPGQKEQARPAASNTSFPAVGPVNFDTATLLALQETDTKAVGEEIEDGKSDAVDEFLDYMKKTPEERLRDKILKALGVTEEDLEAMPPNERMAIEEKIREIIKETIVPEEVTRGANTGSEDAQLSFDQLVQKA